MKEKPHEAGILHQTPYWREQKHESNCFAKMSEVSIKSFQKYMLQQQHRHRDTSNLMLFL